jgi:hypothetical protein
MRQSGELERRLDELEARRKQELDMLAECLKNPTRLKRKKSL